MRRDVCLCLCGEGEAYLAVEQLGERDVLARCDYLKKKIGLFFLFCYACVYWYVNSTE